MVTPEGTSFMMAFVWYDSDSVGGGGPLPGLFAGRAETQQRNEILLRFSARTIKI